MTVEQYQFGDREIRVIDLDGEPWWVAADVGAVLDLSNLRSSLALLDEDEKGVHSMDTPGGPQSITVISESGLYSLILRSRKPEAKAFKKWVTSEVLPSIRRTGSYQAPPVSADTSITARLAEIAHREIVVPSSARVLAHQRWSNPKKGMEAFGELCVQLELDFRPLAGLPEIESGSQQGTLESGDGR
jgi:prophage antirepressor-like protein